jgi:predicted nucleotidyltransferase
MSKNYSSRLAELRSRKNDLSILQETYGYKGYTLDSYNQFIKMASETNDVQNYFIEAMRPVDDIYTKNTYKEAERVKNQLDKIKTSYLNFEYEYQGSVSNNTHIKAHSDIDVLVIIDRFIALEPPLVPWSPYKGNPVHDLMELRTSCENHLTSAFYQADVDCSGAKSIALSGGSLRRKVDVVPSNWLNTVEYGRTGQKHYRGIEVFDKYKKERIANTPFYHNYLLATKDNETAGNVKRVVRLLKTLKADSGNDIELSSYDIVAIAYLMSNSRYLVGDRYILLLKNANIFLKELIQMPSNLRDNLEVPDKSRKIFNESNKLDGLLKLQQEVSELLDSLVVSYGLHDALIEYKSIAV